MIGKNGINKIAGFTLLGLISILIIGGVLELESQLGFSFFNLLYIAGPVFLVWFGTRKNGCGSCNQESRSASESNDQEFKEIP